VAEPDLSHSDEARRLAGVAHDLRQPLDALAIYAELLVQDPAQAAELAPRMARAIALAQGLAQSLQDFAAWRGQAAAPVRVGVHVPTLLAELAAVYEPQARRKGLRWRVRGIDATFSSDPVWLRRMLGNLLANAIRYTAHGGVLLAVRRRAAGWCWRCGTPGPAWRRPTGSAFSSPLSACPRRARAPAWA
jgi:signal transduction histidine kinase